eukprot:Rhum_TRINITY_DN15387_c0_g1::Rhum_TRINITY_DN15387_c0_g1_i5::g.154554::m.154554
MCECVLRVRGVHVHVRCHHPPFPASARSPLHHGRKLRQRREGAVQGRRARLGHQRVLPVAGLHVLVPRPHLKVVDVHALQSLHQRRGQLDVRQQRAAEVDARATHVVSGGELRAGKRARNVDQQINLVRLDHVKGNQGLRVLVVLARLDNLDALDALSAVELGGLARAVQRVAHEDERLHVADERRLRLQRSNRHKDRLGARRQLEASREHRLQKRLVLVHAEARDLARRRHLHTRDGVRALKPREREHRALAAHPLRVVQVDLVRDGRGADHRARRQLDEVDVERLRHEGERPRRTQVHLDDLDVVVLRQELRVHGARDVEACAQRAHDLLDAPHRLDVQLLGRQHQRGVARVHTGVLDVLRHGVVDDAAVLGDGVHLHLLRVLDELRQHNGVLAVHVGGLTQVVHQVRLVVRDVHGGTRQHVRRTHKHRVLRTLRELLRLLDRASVDPLRLVDVQLVAERAELVAVLAHVDALRGRAEDGHTLLRQRQHEVVRDLSSDGNDDTTGALPEVDVQDGLQRQLLEVQPVRLVVVGRHRLRVVVDDDRAQTELVQGAHAADGTPVELAAASDAVRTAAQHDDAATREVDVVLVAVVGCVQVVRLGRELRSKRVHLLHHREDVVHDPHGADLRLRGLHAPGNGAVAETTLLRQHEQVGAHRLRHLLQRALKVDDVLQLAEEPPVDLRQVVHLLHAVAAEERDGDGVDATVARVLQLVVKLLGGELVLVGVGEIAEAVDAAVNHAQT